MHLVLEDLALVRLPKLQAESLGRGLPLRTAAAASPPRFRNFLFLTHSFHCEAE